VKAGLVKGESERTAQAQTEIKERKSQIKERAAEVRALLEGFKKDSAETAAAWRELVATMQARRGLAGAPARAEAPQAVVEAVEEEAAAEEAELEAGMEEETVGEIEVAPGQKAAVELEDEVLSLIAGRPEGIKLVEIAEETGAARIKVGNIARMLVDGGLVRKEGLLYFPS